MKIEQIDGNLLDFPNGINVIAQCCNCFATQGAGIALQIKTRYPEAYKADKDYYAKFKDTPDHRLQLGTYSAARVSLASPINKYIVNLYGQYDYGRESRKLNYEAIYSSMEKLKVNMVTGLSQFGDIVIGFPYNMGCVNAGGDFRIVSSMIETIFVDSRMIKVYIVKYPEPKKG